MTRGDQEDLIVNNANGTCEVIINRPAQRNSLTQDMVTDLTGLVAEVQHDQEVRALILRGAGGFFCAGADLGQIKGDKDRDPGDSGAGGGPAERSAKFASMCTAFADCEIPVITLVEGPAVGGGFGLACCSDICIASSNAKFGFAAQRIGAMPGPIVPFVVDRTGLSVARMLAVTGDVLTATQAQSFGIVHEIAEDVDACLARTVNAIVSCGPDAVRATKRLVLDTKKLGRDALIEKACDLFEKAIQSKEGKEGMAAFAEKRPPNWKS